jgi:hypothetical protein
VTTVATPSTIAVIRLRTRLRVLAMSSSQRTIRFTG